MAKPDTDATDASAGIDAKIAALGDWRGEAMARLRSLTLAADPDIVEEVKWELRWNCGDSAPFPGTAVTAPFPELR